MWSAKFEEAKFRALAPRRGAPKGSNKGISTRGRFTPGGIRPAESCTRSTTDRAQDGRDSRVPYSLLKIFI